MADLPEERLTCIGPFVHFGLDLIGNFYVKEGKKVHKRYIALFTCLASRVVHLECTKDLSMDYFINALRRFLSLRGPVRSIHSDNGSNFSGIETEFQKAFSEMDHIAISSF